MSHPLVTVSAPLIRRAVDTQIASFENDGLTILMTALKLTLPHLGSVNIDFTKLILELDLKDGDDIYVFLSKGQKIESLCLRCRLIIP